MRQDFFYVGYPYAYRLTINFISPRDNCWSPYCTEPTCLSATMKVLPQGCNPRNRSPSPNTKYYTLASLQTPGKWKRVLCICVFVYVHATGCAACFALISKGISLCPYRCFKFSRQLIQFFFRLFCSEILTRRTLRFSDKLPSNYP